MEIGKEITRDGINELPLDLESMTGYCIINADNIDEAGKITKEYPIITSIRAHEVMSV